MCLSSVYMESENGNKEILRDVAKVEAGERGFWMINLFGEREFIHGEIKSINLLDGHFVIMQEKKNS